MIVPRQILAKRTDTRKTNLWFTASLTAISLSLTSLATAAPEVTINQPMTGSTTIVEQYSNGQSAIITSTPNSISMREGMPYSVTQISNTPRYNVYQGGIPSSTTVTTLPLNTVPLNTVPLNTIPMNTMPLNTMPLNTIPVTNQVTQVTQVGVITTPVSTVTQAAPKNLAVVTNQAVPVLANQAVAVTSLDAIQLNPVFNVPDSVNAKTKIMKILKNSAGREVAVPANRINPGDVIEYHTNYTSTAAQSIADLNATVTLPNGVKVVSLNSSLPTLATIGNGNYQTIQQLGNNVTLQENYSGLKWNLANLAINTPQTVIIRATVQ